jgi:hypothetical protein
MSSEKEAAAWLGVVPELAMAPDRAMPRKMATSATADASPINPPLPTAGSFMGLCSGLAASREPSAGPTTVARSSGRGQTRDGRTPVLPCYPLCIVLR